MAQTNKIGNWSDIQVILAVARLGSFQSAANFLEINQSTVGRRIQRLEATLGTKMFDRHVGGMRLSPAGKVLFDKALAMETAAQDIEAKLSGLDTTLAGTVTISVTEGLGYLWLAGVMAEFSAQHPDVDIELITDRQGLKLLHHDADVSIVIERPKDPRLVAAKVANIGHTLFASKCYIERFGLPKSLDQLAHHRLVEYTPNRVSEGMSWWTRKILAENRVWFRADSASIYLSTIRAGVGIGVLPDFYKSAAPDLVPLPIETHSSMGLWLISHAETNQARKTRLLLEHLKRRFREDRTSWFRAYPQPDLTTASSPKEALSRLA